MDLRQALRAGTEIRLALVGGGGKTTAMFQLARQLPGPVLVTTSTHLSTGQLELADHYWTITDPRSIARLESEIQAVQVALFSGKLVEPERVKGPGPEALEALRQLAGRRGWPLLIEADGSRCLPLKAPGEHEPAIPTWANVVVVVAGLSGLGQPLDDEHVHRAERFAALSGGVLGQPVSAELLTASLADPLGGMKNIPPGARRLVLLNQADTPALRESAAWIADRLVRKYDAILTASLREEDAQVFEAREPVAGVILAAGGSQRFGQPKVLLDWHGQPFVRHVAETALRAGLDEVVVVTGAEDGRVRAALADLPVLVAQNPDWQAGQSGSVKVGLRALPENTGAAVFLLADQPQIPASILRQLASAHHRSLATVIAPQVEGRRANPVLFDRQTFPDLLALEGDVGGRAVIAKYPLTWLPSADRRLLLDVDTPEDYQALLDLPGEED